MRESEVVHRYEDEIGNLLFEVVRYPDKEFRQRRPDGEGDYVWNLDDVRRVPFRLQKVIEAVAAGETVYVVEGEKDVLAVEAAGGVATCNPGGAGKWRDEYSEFLRGGRVVVVRDRDEAGCRHAAAIAASVSRVADAVRVVEALNGKDASDHLGAGLGLDEFVPVPAAFEPEPVTVDPDPDAPSPAASKRLLFDPALLTPVGEIEPPRLDGLVHGDEGVLVARGTSALIVGAEGVGKTTLLQHLALSLAAQRPFLGFAVGDGARVLYVGADRPHSQCDSISKLRDQYPDTGDRLITYFAVPGDLLSDQRTLLSMARRANAEVVILDSLYAIAPTDQSMNEDMWARALARSVAALMSAGITLIVAAHPPRNTEGRDKTTNALGSRFQSAGMDTVINLSGKGTVTLSMDKGFGGVEPVRFAIDGETRALRRVGQAVEPEIALATFVVGDPITKKSFAEAMGWESDDRSALARAERALSELTERDRVALVSEGRSGGSRGGEPKTWSRVS